MNEKSEFCQVFNLDEIGKLNEEERMGIKRTPLGPEAIQKVIQRLGEKGYRVFVSGSMICGLPTSLIVVSNPDALHNILKKDFFEITHEEGLDCFASGEFYFPFKL